MKNLLSSKHFKSVIGVVVSALMLFWVLSAIDLEVVGDQLLSASLWPVLFALPVFIFHFVLRAYRWRFFLSEGKDVSIKNLFDAIMVGCLANFLLPLRAGEFVRPFLLAKKEPKISFPVGFASVVIERFFDLFAVLLTFAIAVRSKDGLPEWVDAGAIALAFVALFIFLFIAAAGFFPVMIENVFFKIISKFPTTIQNSFKKILMDLIDSARVIKNPKNLFMIVLLTVFIWISSYLLFYVFLYSLPLPKSPLLAVTLGVIIALAVAAPSAPGFIGVYQTACYASFAVFALNQEYAITFSVITHVFQYVVFITYGFFVLWTSGFKLLELHKRSDEVVSV